jgi:(1->4)-alpha-D-glucan 1-alpha-D-glucosylmutase
MRIPGSTYRLQFTPSFRFADALQILDYLHELGITDLYASPLFKARSGSTHGYDVTDPTRLNPELGSPQQFDELCRELQSRNIGLVLDIVPNHMAASLENPWWFDILEKGEDSRYAGFFDVNWESKKILLPILSKPYGEVLENQEISLVIEDGRPTLRYCEQKLPLAAGAENLGLDSVDGILSRQHYRLAYWRKAADSINYRRFFDINDLVSLRAEREDVFRATHEYLLKLLEKGNVTGLRVDHIDGLLDPQAYLERLPDTYVVSEKILAGNEELPSGWHAEGTTGYDFLNFVNGVFIDPEGFHELKRIYKGFTGSTKTFTEVLHERKRQVMTELFAVELNSLAQKLIHLAEEDRDARDLPTETLKEAFVSVTARLPLYRTYISGEPIAETDHEYIEDSITAAGSGPAFDFLRRVLLLRPAWYIEGSRARYLDFIMRWQQFTGPVMAKGLEDTACYVHNVLMSVNEVGADANGPDTYFGVEQFHRRNLQRRARWPHTLNATSTHDTKRSEDVRARINALSEIPNDWARSIRRWGHMNPSETAPDAAEQLLIYQSILGAWPIEPDRLKEYVIKALREGKTHTSWSEIDERYERRVLFFIDSLYSNEDFQRTFRPLQKKLAYFGALSSLAQVVLKVSSPGVPDFYRGSETWDLSLTDPDNRRPLDFAPLVTCLNELKERTDVPKLLKNWADGRIKMYVTWKLLQFRREHSDLFADGDYIPVPVTGARANHVVAFARRLHQEWCIVAVPRLCTRLTRVGSPPIGEKVWLDTRIELPGDAPRNGRNIFTNRDVSTQFVADLFGILPFAVAAAGPADFS